MKITPEGAEQTAAVVQKNVDRDTTVYRKHQTTEQVEAGGYSLDISGTVMDNSAYAGHGRTAEEVMLEAGQQDISARRNYMAVMSNSMSDEDFARLQKDGFHPGSTDIETVVTIVDHIKAELMKGGTDIVGYTDDISDEALEKVAGSDAFARELKNQFAKHDIPMTQENIEAVNRGFGILNKIDTLSEGAVKYMVENNMDATPENLYLAQFSAGERGEEQGSGYYFAGNVSGYYAKKPETVDVEQLLPQIKKVIEEAGEIINEDTVDQAKWLIEKGIPLNDNTYSALMNIAKLDFPITAEDFVTAAAIAVSNGKTPLQADLTNYESFTEKAIRLTEETNLLTEEAADLILIKELPLTLKNLLAAQEKLNKQEAVNGVTGDTAEIQENIKGRRQLEEVRLSMTVEANLKLLKSGYQIETAPLEDLINKLKQAESVYQKELTGEEDTLLAADKASLYLSALQTVTSIRQAPAAILSEVSETDTLQRIQSIGESQKLIYERAGQSYETMMTAPRRDMGDTINKAFQNVDAILSDLNLSNTESNRKAVRILGYNSLEITEENIKEIRKKADLLTGVIEEMKPGKILQMIKEGTNPVTMPLEELQQYLKDREDPAEEMQSFSKYLYQLEKNNNISEEDRSAYIGIYRLVRQLEKGDEASVGALWQTGTEFTLENLLTANRSSKRKAMDYTVDDNFGGMMAKESGTKSITEQLAAVFQEYEVSPKAQNKEAEIEILKEMTKDIASKQTAEEFDNTLFGEMRTAVKSEEAIWQQLINYNMPVTCENLMNANMVAKNSTMLWNRLGKTEDDKQKPNEQTDEASNGIQEALQKEGQQILSSMVSKAGTQAAYEGFAEIIKETLEDMTFKDDVNSLDIKAMSNAYKQMSFMGKMAQEENYEIPVFMNGSFTSINLKIIHANEQQSKAVISFETELTGKTAAEFKITEQGLTGYCICDSEQGTKVFSQNRNELVKMLESEQLETKDIYFVTSANLNLEEFASKETEHRKREGDAGQLYRVARTFIEFTRDMGIREGKAEYEN